MWQKAVESLKILILDWSVVCSVRQSQVNVSHKSIINSNEDDRELLPDPSESASKYSISVIVTFLELHRTTAVDLDLYHVSQVDCYSLIVKGSCSKRLIKCLLFDTSRLYLSTLGHLLSAALYRDGRDKLAYRSPGHRRPDVLDPLAWTLTPWPFRGQPKGSVRTVALNIANEMRSSDHHYLSRQVSKAVDPSQVAVVQSIAKWLRVIAGLFWYILDVGEWLFSVVLRVLSLAPFRVLSKSFCSPSQFFFATHQFEMVVLKLNPILLPNLLLRVQQ